MFLVHVLVFARIVHVLVTMFLVHVLYLIVCARAKALCIMFLVSSLRSLSRLYSHCRAQHYRVTIRCAHVTLKCVLTINRYAHIVQD
jgi:hypothetical protein